MLKFLMPVAAIGLMTATPAVLPIPAAAAPNPGMLFCKDVITPPPQDRNLGNLGECTSLFTVPSAAGSAAKVCAFWEESGQLEDFGYHSYVECVQGEHERVKSEE